MNYKYEKRISDILPIGKQLSGCVANYEIIETIGSGAFGQTYKAKVIKTTTTSAEVKEGQLVVIKTPTIYRNLPRHEKIDRLMKVIKTFIIDYTSMKRLRDLDCVAQVFDYGTYLYDLNPEDKSDLAPTLFTVQQLIDGKRLDHYMKGEKDCFKGIQEPEIFFGWAIKLAEKLLHIHQRSVIHGDIWSQNIMVDTQKNPVYIDFGQSLFRDLVVVTTRKADESNPYVPPEGRGYIGADIYSLGGVLHFLATGQTPPLPITNNDELKNIITETLKTNNPKLYNGNSGVVDVIARCLRHSEHDRIPHAEGLIQDIKVFAAPQQPPDLLEEGKAFTEELKSLGEINNILFSQITSLRIRLLRCHIKDMRQGILDLTGDHEDIATCLSQYLSVLGTGDQYLTVTIPSFWHPENLGINGRFLTMNKLAAQHGVTIRRVFLITHEEETNPHIRNIITAHVRIMKEIAEIGITTNDRDTDGRGYYTGFKYVDKNERDFLVREGKHFGLWVKEDKEMLIYLVYNEKNIIVTVQFRSSSDRAATLKSYIKELLEDSVPLEKHPLLAVQ